MSKLSIIRIILFSFSFLLIFFINYIFFFKTEYRVLHAGGFYKNQIYTNSIEALEKNKKDFKYFELDFQLTKDNKLICEHDIDPNIIFYNDFLKKNSKKKKLRVVNTNL